MTGSAWIPGDIPLDRPSAARMYDYFLGGYHNFDIDRRAADAVTATYPDFPLVMRANRAFLRRAVTYLSEHGIDQFLDLGSGIPTVGSVHEVAQQLQTTPRVVYVDVDPIAVSHSRTILRQNPNAAIIHADMREPATVLDHPTVRDLLDFRRPLAVLLVSVLHFLTDGTAASWVTRVFRDILPAGGYLVLSHATKDRMPEETAGRLEALYARTTNSVVPRTYAQVVSYFDGLDLVEPGLVYPPLWRPEGADDLLLMEPERSVMYAGVGRKQ